VPPGEFYFKSVLYTDSPNVVIALPLPLARKIVELEAEWIASVWSPRRLAAAMAKDVD